MILMKFGGSSVADAERITAVGGIVRRNAELRPVVVVSALSGVTDLLEQAIEAATLGNMAPAARLIGALARPFDDPAEPDADLTRPPTASERVHQTFCGT